MCCVLSLCTCLANERRGKEQRQEKKKRGTDCLANVGKKKEKKRLRRKYFLTVPHNPSQFPKSSPFSLLAQLPGKTSFPLHDFPIVVLMSRTFLPIAAASQQLCHIQSHLLLLSFTSFYFYFYFYFLHTPSPPPCFLYYPLFSSIYPSPQP